jgi:hypothetical protein
VELHPWGSKFAPRGEVERWPLYPVPEEDKAGSLHDVWHLPRYIHVFDYILCRIKKSYMNKCTYVQFHSRFATLFCIVDSFFGLMASPYPLFGLLNVFALLWKPHLTRNKQSS